MKMLGKLVFAVAAAGVIAPAFAFTPSPTQDHRDWHDDHHDDRHDDRRDWHDDHHRGPPPPPPRVVDHRGPPPWAHHHWERGHRYDGRVIVVDRWHDYRGLREPPRGYHWVRDDDDGQFLLVAVATGIIADIVLQQ